MPRFVTRAFAAVGLLGLVAGVPLLLWQLAPPRQWWRTEWLDALVRPGDPTAVLTVLGIAGWIAWFVLALSAVLEILDVLTRGAHRWRLPGTGWARPAVRILVVTALGGVVLSPVASADEPRPAEYRAVAGQDPGTTADPATPTAAGRTYVVVAGDELWTIAERELGSGERWRDIVALNAGLGAEAALTPGQRLTLPSPPPEEPGGSVVVEDGDTLWALAEQHLGSGERWPELHAANADLVADPDHLHVGWELRLPGRATATLPHPAAHPHEKVTDPAADTGPATGRAEPASGEDDQERSTRGSSESVSRETATPHPEPQDSAPPAAAPRGPDLPDPADDPGADVHDAELGTVGGVLAASVVAGVVARRRLQMLDRAVGRRIAPLAPNLQRFLGALVRRRTEQAQDPGLPSTGVVLGWSDERPVLHDVEAARCTIIEGAADEVLGLQAAVLTSLACAEWSSQTEIVLVGDVDGWAASLDDPRVRSVASLPEALVDLQRTCARRRIEMAGSQLGELRADGDVADAWRPVVFLVSEQANEAELDRIDDCLSLGQVGVSVVLRGPVASSREGWERITVSSTATAHVVSTGERFEPQLLSAPARRALVDLLGAASSQETEPAPWWRDDLPPNVSVLPSADGALKDSAMPPWSTEPAHPTLLLLGPTELIGCRGAEPTRARGQCIEYCAWLLERPGSSAVTMTRDLLVAEPTRRSNMSRLRSWLGTSPDGDPYLPDAYSGRIQLHPSVSSDWERFQLLLSGGVNAASPSSLREALSLVRGEPLEGAAFQWPWASSLLTDMVAMVTDAAVVLAERSLDAEDTVSAQWAITQGRLAAPGSEAIQTAEIRMLALAGDHEAVQQKALALSRAARAQGRDLAPDTIRRIQGALHAARVAN